MILYHIMADTGCLPDDVVPQIPTNRMKGEDQEIPRICLGHTLDDCLTSIGIAHFVSKFLLAELRQNKKYSKDMPLQNEGRESPRFQPWDDRPTIMVFFVSTNIIIM